MTSSEASVPEPPMPHRRQPWLAGLTWKGVALLLLLCALNALRRTSDRVLSDPIDAWLPDAALSLASGLVVAVVVTLAVVATYNRVTQPRLRYPALAVAIVVSTVLGDVILFALDTGGKFDFGEFGGPLWAFVGTWPRHVLLAFLLTAVFVHVRMADESEAAAKRADLDRARFAQQMDEARLQMLQAQIEPHFLFNTLANIRRLYARDAAAGESMLDNLMAYLAVALPQMRAAESTLGREAALTEAYLGVQRIRMGRRLTFVIEIAEPLRSARMPPMMLVTLAENAIKHGLAPLPEGGHVCVSAAVADDRLCVQVADSGVGFGASSGDGTGLANIRARLATLYGSSAELELEVNQPRGVIARISLPNPGAQPAKSAA